MHPERFYIDKCLHLIEVKYQLGESGWRQRDMEYLSGLIKDRSGIVLSLSTIKRLIKSDDQVPQPATLNALVSIIGYNDWQQFKIENSSSPKTENKKSPVALILSLGLAIAVISWLVISGFGSTPKHSTVEIDGPVTFTSDKTLSTGVPNTVVFKYDLSNVTADSFFIQQSWNDLEKRAINPLGEYFTSIYYYPGFHRAKLIANDSIVLRQFVHITTDGWFPAVRYKFEDTVPVYINRRFEENEPLSLTADDLLASGVDLDQDFYTSFYNVRDFGDISSDNFYLGARLKLDSIKPMTCPLITMVVMTEEHIFEAPLIKKGCENKIYLKMGEVVQEGSDNDLSAFGSDIYQWQHLELKVVNKLATLSLNGREIRSIKFTEDYGKVVGITLTFSGVGSVQHFDLSNDPLQPGVVAQTTR